MSAASKRVPIALLLALLSIGVALVLIRSQREAPSDSGTPSGRVGQALAAKSSRFEAREREMDRTVWAKEMLAEQCGRVFDALWDALNKATNKLALVASFPVGEIGLGDWKLPRTLPHGIELREAAGPGATLPTEAWRGLVADFDRAGWQLEQIEFRHNRFDTDPAGQPRQSHFFFSAHLIQPGRLAAWGEASHGPSFGPRVVLSPQQPGSPSSGGGSQAARDFGAAAAWDKPRSHPTAEGRSGELSGVMDRPTARTEGDAPPERAIIEGDLVVDWADGRTNDGSPAVKRIDASGLKIETRRGEPPFQPILLEPITPPEKSDYVDPLILYDLDGDGLSEIILAAKNRVYRRHGDRYEPEPLCRYPPGPITAGVIADFDGDGVADFLCAKPEGLVLFKGSSRGAFDEPGRLVWSASPHLVNAMALTCGDIDRDGDLDVFVGQYQVPTLGQILRPHYYDANDGYPAYLLLNDGHGNFTDATAAAGLEKKRWRRTYSASFVDVNGGGHLDLVVVSDFAGVDLYRNDGRGRFTDVTGEWVAEPHAFGMAHALADFNADGRLDLLMIGMPSPTVDRLEHLGLWRPDAAEDHTMRSRMTFGNRLYLARPGGGFEETPLNGSIARSGWSWGCSAFDFDNDGFPDVYIANGMQTKQSVRDYEGEFWLHDIYVGDSVDDVTATTYFTTKFARTRGQGWSYGGYEKNRLFLNQDGKTFREAGYLMGVALEQDCRNVVADDLDGDGRVDLLVTTLEVWPEVKQTLRVYRNTLPDSGHWIGFRFREEVPGASPIGARVTVHYGGRSAVREVVTGDSHRSQHATTVHFGLGDVGRVDDAAIRWPNGQTVTLQAPAVDRYHMVHASAAR